MANYISGTPQDYVPVLQPFRPDLNYYSNILQTSQSQYDAAHQQVSSQYSTLLNSPMIRDENVQRRDNFFKAIEGDLKKVSKLDLSQQQNVTTAMSVFRPLYEDKDIVKDMTYTKQRNNAYSIGENFRSCPDPEKCGGAYWEDGMKRIQYESDEFKNASREDALQMTAPSYHPFVNLTKQALKASKDLGFEITQDTIKGGYRVTDTNGNLLSGDKNKWGILPNALYSIFKDDQKVMDVFKTKAYVARKDYGMSNAAEHGSADAAEMHYAQNILASSIKQLTTDAEKSKEIYAETDNNLKVLQKKDKEDGGTIPNSPEDGLMQAYARILESRPAAEAHHDKVMSTINTTINLQDQKALLRRADDIVAYNGFRTEIWNAADEYAFGTAKQSVKADEYSLENVKFQHDLQKTDYEFETWKKKKNYETGAVINQLMSLGLSEADAVKEAALSGTGGISKERIKEIQRDKGKEVRATTAPIGQVSTDINPVLITENDKIINEQHAGVASTSLDYLVKTADTLKAAYNQKDPVIKENALRSLRSIFGGTNFDVQKFLNNSIVSGDVYKIGDSAIVGRYKVAADLADKPEASYWAPALVAQQVEASKQKQVFDQMFKARGEATKTMISNWTKDVAQNPVDVLAVASIVNPDASIKKFDDAKRSYADAAAKYYYTKPNNATEDSKGGYYIYGKGNPVYVSREQRISEAHEKAANAFDTGKYTSLLKEYNKRYTDVGGKFLTGTETFEHVGGGKSVQKSLTQPVNPMEETSANTKVGLDFVETYANNPDAVVITDSPIPLNKFLSDFQSDFTQGKNINSTDFDIARQIVPAGTDGSTEDKVRFKVTPHATYIKKQITTKNYSTSTDYSWYVDIPASEDRTGFTQSTKLSGAQMVMGIPGNMLTYSNPTYGNTTLHHDAKLGYYYSGTVRAFDADANGGKGEYYDASIPTKYLADVDADEAYSHMVSSLQDYYYNVTEKDIKARKK